MYFTVSVILGFLIVSFVIIYNSIIRAKNSVEENISTIDVMFQNRYDLIPNLVKVVKKYTEYEKSALESVTEIRSGAMSGQKLTEEKIENENILSGTLKSIFALAENYPDLKADSTFINLQNEWSRIEDNLQAARRSYNSAVKTLRDKEQTIPSNIVASIMKIENYTMYETSDEAKKPLYARELFSK